MSASAASKQVELEFALRIAVVGPVSVGKSQLIQQLVLQPALNHCLDPGLAHVTDDKVTFMTGADDELEWQMREQREEEEKEEQKLTQKEEGKQQEEEEQEGRPKRILPTLNSLGVSFSHGSFVLLDQDKISLLDDSSSSSGMDSENRATLAATAAAGAEKRKVKATLRLEFFEVGGATCCHEIFSDSKTLEETIKKCDVVLAIYDLCEKKSFEDLCDKVLFENIFKLPQNLQRPVIISGNKFDKRKFKLTESEKKRAVTKSDQTSLDQRLPHHAVLTGSVSAWSGYGCLKLRRELIYEALHASQRLLENSKVFSVSPLTATRKNNNNNTNNALENNNVWKTLEAQRSFLSQLVAPNRKKGQEFLTVIQQQQQQQEKETFSPKSGEPHPADEKEEPPVIDVKSNKGDDDDKPEKGCGCGCLCQ